MNPVALRPRFNNINFWLLDIKIVSSISKFKNKYGEI